MLIFKWLNVWLVCIYNLEPEEKFGLYKEIDWWNTDEGTKC